MILYDLTCANDHVFEAWFKNAASFDDQASEGAVGCPQCGDTSIRKAPMAPALNTGRHTPPEAVAAAMHKLRELQTHVETTCEHVGPRFATEARKIHLGETERRSIYGEATKDEAKSLREDGVAFGTIPWLPRRQS
jgi:hypothetical protein